MLPSSSTQQAATPLPLPASDIPAPGPLFDLSTIHAAGFLGALGVLYPILSRGVYDLATEWSNHNQADLSAEAATWIFAEFQALFGGVCGSAAEEMMKASERMTSREVLIEVQSTRLSLKKRLRRNIEARPCRTAKVSPARRSPSRTAEFDLPTGRLFAVFQGSLNTKTWPLGDEDTGRVSFCFIPRSRFGLPGVAASFTRRNEDLCYVDSVLSTFDVLQSNSKALEFVTSGDVPGMLKGLRQGDFSASDRDRNGKSLLTVSLYPRLMINLTNSMKARS